MNVDQLNQETRATRHVFKAGNTEWDMYWTGWKVGWDSAFVCGQWLALDREACDRYRRWRANGERGDYVVIRRAYSSSPGWCGWYEPGMQFDISCYGKKGQVRIDYEDIWNDPEIVQLANEQCQLALKALKEFLLEEGNVENPYRL